MLVLAFVLSLFTLSRQKRKRLPSIDDRSIAKATDATHIVLRRPVSGCEFNGYRHMPPTLLKREEKEDVCMYVVVKIEYVLKEGGFFLYKR